MNTDTLDAKLGTRLTMAQMVCDVAHDGQVRWDGTPFVEHPKGVAARAGKAAKDMGFDLDFQIRVVIVGLLHDVIEDTELDAKFIAKRFGTSTAVSVMVLTRPSEEVLPKKLAQQIYENQLRGASLVEILVKLADICHNAGTIPVDQRRAASWAVNSAQASLRVIRRWQEDYCAQLTGDQLEVLDAFYAEATDAVDMLLAGGSRKRVDDLNAMRKAVDSGTVVPE